MKFKTTSLLNHLPIIAVELDSDLNVTEHSPAFKNWALTGEIIGKKLPDLLPDHLFLQLA